jgi:hypothetical protein
MADWNSEAAIGTGAEDDGALEAADADGAGELVVVDCDGPSVGAVTWHAAAARSTMAIVLIIKNILDSLRFRRMILLPIQLTAQSTQDNHRAKLPTPINSEGGLAWAFIRITLSHRSRRVHPHFEWE